MTRLQSFDDRCPVPAAASARLRVRAGLTTLLGVLAFAGSIGVASTSEQVSSETEVPLVLPPGFEWPDAEWPIPEIGPPPSAANERLRFDGPARVVHTVDLDATPRRWANRLLHITVGHTTPWPDSPNTTSVAMPQGSPSFNHHAVALLAGVPIVFDGNLWGRADQPVQSVNPTGYTLNYDGQHVWVTDTRWRWRFAWTPDPETKSAGIWRLDQITSRQFDDDVIRLTYDTEGRLNKIGFPNTTEAVFHRDNRGYVARVTAPLGQEAVIRRNPDGHIIGLDRFVTRGDPPVRRRTARYAYERDAGGRLLSFTDANRVQWRANADASPSGNGGFVWTSTITDNAVAATRSETWTQTADGHDLRVERGAHARGIDRETAAELGLVQTETISRGLPHRKDRVLSPAAGFWANAAGGSTIGTFHGQAFLLDAEPSGVASSLPDDDDATIERDHAGRVVRVIEGEGEGENAPATHYRYTDGGDLFQIERHGEGQPHAFIVDDWGRITEHREPDGGYTQWRFDSAGEIEAIVRGDPLPQDERDLFAETRHAVSTTTFTRSPEGRLARVEDGHSGVHRFDYGSDGLLKRHQLPDRTQVRYRFDRLGRLIERTDAVGLTENYAYHPDDTLAERTARKPREPLLKREYDPAGRLVAETIGGFGRTQYEYDELGRQKKIVHPDGSDTIYAYDDLSRVTSIRGSHQPPVDIAYDENGRRTVTPAPGT